jgi:probable F420-dependent oxidoreductase
MKIDTILAMGPMKHVGKIARRAEEMGFSGIFTAEALQTPFMPLALAAMETEKVELGTAIAVAFPRSPMVHAMTAWDLHKASNGRFNLGLGTQIRKHNMRRFSVPFDPPGPRMKDMLLAIRHIWDCFDGKHKLDHHGEFYTHDYMQPFFNPGPTGFGQPKLFIAAVGPYMCRLAGEVCDGMHIHPFHTKRYLEEAIAPQVREGCKRSGRSIDDFEFATTTFVMAGTPEEQAGVESIARAQIAFYGSTPAYRKVFEMHGWSELQPQLADMVRSGKQAEMPGMISDEVLAEFSIRGRFDDIADLMRAKYGELVQRVGFYIPVIGSDKEGEYAEIIRDLAAQVSADRADNPSDVALG